MRLTVGPLPAAVYWRRRLVVLAGLAMVILIITYACTGDSTSGNPQQADPQRATSPSATQSASTPVTSSATPTRTPAATFTLPGRPANASCTDDEIAVTAAASPAEIVSGQPVDFSIKIKNTSNRTCQRDIGADVQELRLLYQDRIIWSSDDCNPNTGTDVRTFQPGQEVSFTRRWDHRRSRSGDGTVNCSLDGPENGDIYQLVARLDKKLSEPFTVRVRM